MLPRVIFLFISYFIGIACSKNILDPKIVGGFDTTIEEFPHQLSLENYGVHFCGASLISEKYVITAAHCTESKSVESLSIRAGTSIRNYEGQVVGIKKLINHPKYDTDTVDYDIAILELETPLKFSDKIKPIQIINAGVDVTGKKAIVTGWGLTGEDGDFASDLQKLEVPIFTISECTGFYGNEFTDRMMCAGFLKGGKDSCQGDSGGPLIVDNVLVGVVSWGEGCARPRKPGIYSKVSVLRNFIFENTGM